MKATHSLSIEVDKFISLGDSETFYKIALI